MAGLNTVVVESVQVDLPASGDAAGAVFTFGLSMKNGAGAVLHTVAQVNAADWPTDESTFESVMWSGAFAAAAALVSGEAWPPVPEWSPWPIV